MIADWDVNGIFLADMLKVRHPDLFTQLHSVLTSYGVEVRLLTNVKDIWARDYCPVQIGPDEFVQFRYEPDYLKDHPELCVGREIADQFRDLGGRRHAAINLDGGNVVASRTKAIVTDKIYRENPSWDRSKLRDELRRVLHVEELIVVPKEPYDPIGHADAMVRFINDDAVLVNDYSEIDPAFGKRLLNVLCGHGLATEFLPYFHEQHTSNGIPSAVGCFANFVSVRRTPFASSWVARRGWMELGGIGPVAQATRSRRRTDGTVCFAADASGRWVGQAAALNCCRAVVRPGR